MTPFVLLIGFVGFVVLWKARPFWRAGVAIAGVTVFALAAWMLAPTLFVPTPFNPSGRLVGWELGRCCGGGPLFGSATAQTTTVVPMMVDHPACHGNDSDWLGEPAIAYTPWSVTITMHTRDGFGNANSCYGMYLSGMPTRVQLSEPLGGRQLYDGSKSPPHPRSPGDPMSSVSR
jgi:hypothetical protein